MPETRPRVLLADASSAWRDLLVDLLVREQCVVEVTDSGADLLAALTDPTGAPSLVVVGQCVGPMMGHEALYQYSRAIKGPTPDPREQREIMLVSEARSDIELLDLFRARGVTGFLYRDDPVEKTALKIVKHVRADRRPYERHVIRLDATIKIRGMSYPGAVFDLSLVGAQVVCSPSDLREPPAIGEWVDLEFGYGDDARVACRGEVCRLSRQKSLFGPGTVLGIQFERLDDRNRNNLELSLTRAIEEIETARRG